MALPDSNFGTQVYLIPCGVPSDADIAFFLSANSGTHYLYNVSRDFVIWDQAVLYPHPQTNIGTVYYFTYADQPSDANIQFYLSSNLGTHFWSNSSFIEVPFC